MTTSDPRLRFVVLTNASQAHQPLIDVIDKVVSAGVKAIVVREKHLPEHDRLSVIKSIADVAKPAGCLVLAASRSWGAVDGVHLASNDAMPTDRPPIVGKSCHSLSDVQAAEQQGCDYVTLSPIFLSRSKPGYGPALGTNEIERICGEVAIPVIALGGVNPANAGDCIAAGATGVAVMGEVMRSPDVTQTIDAFRNQLGATSPYPTSHG